MVDMAEKASFEAEPTGIPAITILARKAGEETDKDREQSLLQVKIIVLLPAMTKLRPNCRTGQRPRRPASLLLVLFQDPRPL